MLAVVYLIFNEGYTASAGEHLVRAGLCAEAIRLGRLLAGLMPDEPEVLGLLALLLLVEARRAARTTAAGDLVPLAEQDRGRWDRALIAEGQALVRRCLRLNRPGPYQIQAAINAVHSDAPTGAATDWGQILQLYDQLLALTPPAEPPGGGAQPGGRRGRGARTASGARPLDALPSRNLDGYHLFHAVRADLLRRLGRAAEATAAYEAALARTTNEAERAFLQRRREEIAREVTAGEGPAGGGLAQAQ